MRRLLDEHSISKGEKTIFLFNRSAIDLQHVLSVVKRADQHEQRTLGQVKIGDERINRLETVAGIDKDARITAHGVYDTVIVRRALQRTA